MVKALCIAQEKFFHGHIVKFADKPCKLAIRYYIINYLHRLFCRRRLLGLIDPDWKIEKEKTKPVKVRTFFGFCIKFLKSFSSCIYSNQDWGAGLI